MTNSQKLSIRLSEIRQRLNEIAGLEGDALTDEIRAEADRLTAEFTAKETQYRAAVVAEGESLDRQRSEADNSMTPEQRERLDLRGRVSIGAYLRAALTGRAVNGAEAELQQAAGVDGIPLEAFDTRDVLEARARRDAGTEHRAITPAPGTVGINLDPIRPAVFAPSIADKLGIDMPTVTSGTYATGTISTSTTADAVAKSADVPQTAGAITVGTTAPKRMGASLALTLEDIAAVGTANFEAILRDNVSLALSDELDEQMINGDGQTNDLTGILARLTDPDAPAANVETFDRLVAVFAGGIDGLWANTIKDVGIVAGVDTYRLATQTFRDRVIDTGNRGGVSLGDESFADYAARLYGGFWTNKRMPAKANHVQAGILYRTGRAGMRTAVCPTWGYIGIDDIYSGARKGERYFTLSVLVGDVILVQPDAYAQVAFRVST